MIKRLIFCGEMAALTLLSSGCFFWGETKKQPEIYDLPVQEEKVSLQPLYIGTVRNLSGADRRVLLRENNSRIRQIEDYLWLLPPAAMLERKLKEKFAVETVPEKVPVLHTTLRHFEFNLEENEAFFGVSYEIVMPDHRRIAVSGNYREKVQDEKYAAAMSRAIRRSMNDLEAALNKKDRKIKK